MPLLISLPPFARRAPGHRTCWTRGSVVRDGRRNRTRRSTIDPHRRGTPTLTTKPRPRTALRVVSTPKLDLAAFDLYYLPNPHRPNLLHEHHLSAGGKPPIRCLRGGRGRRQINVDTVAAADQPANPTAAARKTSRRRIKSDLEFSSAHGLWSCWRDLHSLQAPAMGIVAVHPLVLRGSLDRHLLRRCICRTSPGWMPAKIFPCPRAAAWRGQHPRAGPGRRDLSVDFKDLPPSACSSTSNGTIPSLEDRTGPPFQLVARARRYLGRVEVHKAFCAPGTTWCSFNRRRLRRRRSSLRSCRVV